MKTVRTAHVVKDLAKLLTSCKFEYYNGDISVSDEEYDKLEEMLTILCPQHPILATVGIPGDDYRNPQIGEVVEMLGVKDEV